MQAVCAGRHKGIEARAYLEQLMARHTSVQQECTAVLERSLQGLVDAEDTMCGLEEDIDELDGQARTNEEEGDETKREGDATLQLYERDLGEGRGRLQVLHAEATEAAREVAEGEKALELEKMQRQLEKTMAGTGEKLKEKENALNEVRILTSYYHE